MKYIVFILLIFISTGNQILANTEIKYNESLLPYKGGILISNMGSIFSKYKCGYILYYKNKKLMTFIPAGTLDKPTAMAVYKNKLYICDRDRICPRKNSR